MKNPNSLTRNVLTEKLLKTESEKEEKLFYQSEPSRNNMFYVEFPNEFGIPSYAIQTCNRPLLLNMEWQNMEITFLEFMEPPTTTQGLMRMIEMCKYREILDELFRFYIDSVSMSNRVNERWVVSVEKLLMVDFDCCDYDNERIQKLRILIKPKNCWLANLLN